MKTIGTVIYEHRMAKGLTQGALGKEVHVSKQAVSKWENDRTLPDIETVRRLCDILDIDRDEILGRSMEATKQSRRWFFVSLAVALICFCTTLFFALDVPSFLARRTQSGMAYISVFADGELLPTSAYHISGIEPDDFQNGYGFAIDYGELCGVIHLSDGREIAFTFVNPNNWHHVQIRFDVETRDEIWSVTQTVSYKTDGDRYDVIVTRSEASEKRLSVYGSGI